MTTQPSAESAESAEAAGPPASAAPATVVFDIGGVLLDWDPRHLYRKTFADPAEMEWFLTHVCHTEWNVAQDAGRSWQEAEAEAIARHPSYAAQIRHFRSRWHEMVPGPIAGTVAILEALARADVPLYAITNFSGDTYREARERHAFFRHFRGVAVSGDLCILKPEPGIYRHLATTHDVELTRAIFIDDVEKNVAGARAVGMHAIRFVSPERLAADLRGLGFAV